MSGYWTDVFSYLTGAIRENDLVYLVMGDDEALNQQIPLSSIVQWEPDGWGDGGQVDWNCVDATVARHPLEQLIVLGQSGEVLALGSGDRHEERIPNRAPIRGATTIEGLVYAVGMDRQVFQRVDSNHWSPLEDGLKISSNVSGFEAINGTSAHNIFAVGWEGEIWHYDGKRWTQQVSPVTDILVDVCCSEDGYVYASGRNGLLLRGKAGSWEVLPQKTSESLWSLADFEGKLYAASYDGVYVLGTDLSLHPVEFGSDEPSSFGKLVSGCSMLWSIGLKDVMSYDGQSWTRID